MNAAAIGGTGVIAAIALVLGGWLKYNKDAPKFTTFLFLIGGTGIGGLFGLLMTRLFDAASSGLSVGSQWLGLATSAVIAAFCLVATLEVVVKGILPKTAKPKGWHPWLALVAPTLAMVAGVPVLSGFYVMLSRGMASAGTVAQQWFVG